MSIRSARPRRPFAVLASLPLLLAGIAPVGPARAAESPQAPATKPSSAASATATLAAGKPAQPASFSVDMEVKQGDQTITMRRIVDGGKLRMDIKGQGHDMSLIQLDDDKRTMYTISPERKMVMKQSMAAQMERVGRPEAKAAAAPKSGESAGSQGTIELLGQETLDGKPADKYKVTYPEGSGTMWMDAQTSLPLRMETAEGSVEFKNYQFGPQPPELFQPPAGMQVQDFDALMAGMPKNMMAGMAGGLAGGMGGSLGGSLGSSLGGALGGPLGSMVGQFVGQKVGEKLGHKVAGAATGTGK